VLGIKVQGSGFRVVGLGFRVEDWWARVWARAVAFRGLGVGHDQTVVVLEAR